MKQETSNALDKMVEKQQEKNSMAKQAQNQMPDQMMEQGMQKTVQVMRNISNSHHAAPIHAFIRQGADELAQVLAAFPDGVQPVSEPGQMLEPTSQEVTQENKKKVDLETDRIVAPEQTPAKETPAQDKGLSR